MLFLVGIGLSDPEDITVKGLDIVKRAHKVFLESYTSILCHGSGVQALEKLYGRKVLVADRELVESDNNPILDSAHTEDVVLLVVGDPFGATTHSDLLLRAKARNIPFKVIHNASIMNAVACTGLQLYSFGETVSIPFWTDDWKPSSFVDKINRNLKYGLHTLCLLDIKVKEKSIEALMKGKEEYEEPRFMSASVAAQQLLSILQQESTPGNGDSDRLRPDSVVVAVARVGSQEQRIVSCSLEQMCRTDMGPPLHSLVVAGKMHPLEQEMLSLFQNTSSG